MRSSAVGFPDTALTDELLLTSHCKAEVIGGCEWNAFVRTIKAIFAGCFCNLAILSHMQPS